MILPLATAALKSAPLALTLSTGSVNHLPTPTAILDEPALPAQTSIALRPTREIEMHVQSGRTDPRGIPLSFHCGVLGATNRELRSEAITSQSITRSLVDSVMAGDGTALAQLYGQLTNFRHSCNTKPGNKVYVRWEKQENGQTIQYYEEPIDFRVLYAQAKNFAKSYLLASSANPASYISQLSPQDVVRQAAAEGSSVELYCSSDGSTQEIPSYVALAVANNDFRSSPAYNWMIQTGINFERACSNNAGSVQICLTGTETCASINPEAYIANLNQNLSAFRALPTLKQ